MYLERSWIIMRKYMLTKCERETIVLFNEAEPTANIYTNNTALKNRLAKFSKENPGIANLKTEYPCGGMSYEVDKRRLSIRLTTPYSEERRNAARKYAQEHSIVSNLNRTYRVQERMILGENYRSRLVFGQGKF